MPVNFPSTPTPYGGNSKPGLSPAETSLPPGAGKVRPGEVASQDALGAARAVLQGPPDLDWERFGQPLFGAGGQVPLESPPPPVASSAQQSLAGKFLSLLPGIPNTSIGNGGASTASAPTPAHFSIDAVLHLLLSTSVEEFQEAQLESREDTQEKMADMDTAAADIKAAAKQRLSGAIAAGAGAIVAGTLSIAGAGINLRGGVVANKALDGMEDLTASSRPMAFQAATNAYSGAAQAVQGTGQGLQGGMGVLQAEDEEPAAEDDAAKAEADKAAADDDALHETAASMRQEFLSVMQDFLDKEKGWEQSQDQTMMTLARNV